MSQYKSKYLQKLIAQWDLKLEESGFHDVESRDKKTGELRLSAWDSHYFQIRTTPDVFESKQEYYLQAHHFLNSYKFKTQTEVHIWQMHSEGYGLRQIAQSLRDLGIRTNKDYVATIVIRLKKAMKERNEG